MHKFDWTCPNIKPLYFDTYTKSKLIKHDIRMILCINNLNKYWFQTWKQLFRHMVCLLY